jgi:hypothetical protein
MGLDPTLPHAGYVLAVIDALGPLVRLGETAPWLAYELGFYREGTPYEGLGEGDELFLTEAFIHVRHPDDAGYDGLPLGTNAFDVEAAAVEHQVVWGLCWDQVRGWRYGVPGGAVSEALPLCVDKVPAPRTVACAARLLVSDASPVFPLPADPDDLVVLNGPLPGPLQRAVGEGDILGAMAQRLAFYSAALTRLEEDA